MVKVWKKIWFKFTYTIWVQVKVWIKVYRLPFERRCGLWTELKFQKDIWMTLTKKVKSWGQGLEEDLDQV